MTTQAFSNLIFTNQDRIMLAASTGAAWELWLQVELALAVRGQQGMSVAREVHYPAPNQGQTVDLVMQVGAAYTAVELKVESATNATTAVLPNALLDVAKIRNFALPPAPAGSAPTTLARWVVVLGYSAVARAALQAASVAPLAAGVLGALYTENTAHTLGVLVLTA